MHHGSSTPLAGFADFPVSPGSFQTYHSYGRWPGYGFSYRSPGCYSSESTFRFQEVLFHEAGHATVAEALIPGSVRVIVVNKKGAQTSGFCTLKTFFELACEPSPRSVELGIWDVAVSLGGKAAVEQNLNMVGEGCSSDYRKATSGLDDYITTGYMQGVPCHERDAYIAEMRPKINSEVSAELNRLFSKTKELLSANRNLLIALVSELSRKLILSASEIAEIERKFPPVPISL